MKETTEGRREEVQESPAGPLEYELEHSLKHAKRAAALEQLEMLSPAGEFLQVRLQLVLDGLIE